MAITRPIRVCACAVKLPCAHQPARPCELPCLHNSAVVRHRAAEDQREHGRKDLKQRFKHALDLALCAAAS